MLIMIISKHSKSDIVMLCIFYTIKAKFYLIPEINLRKDNDFTMSMHNMISLLKKNCFAQQTKPVVICTNNLRISCDLSNEANKPKNVKLFSEHSRFLP